MKWLIWSVAAVTVFGAFPAQAQKSSNVGALPPGCTKYPATADYGKEGALWCVAQALVKSGVGKSWGDPVYITSTAPKGYKLRWSEAHVESKDHHCGVKDEGDKSPSPFNNDNPQRRAGEAFWAQCIIWERDDHHVVAKANIQGWEGAKILGYGDGKITWEQHRDWGTKDGTVTLYTIYWPID
jgi:hypothetical protein